MLRRIDPTIAYYVLKCGHAFFFTLVVSVSLIWQTTDVRLSPMELLLVWGSFQGAILASEMPTGIVADTYSRKGSVIIGFALLGFGMCLSGIYANFWPILLGHLIGGLGHTFISGAAEAWIADEVGVERANRVYLRAAQLTKISWVVAVPTSIAIATQQLNLPILLGGLGLVWVAALLLPLMSEEGFDRPARAETRQTWSDLADTFREGRHLVGVSPLLVTILLITAFYGVAGQGFTTLWVAHLDQNTELPSIVTLEPVIWLGAVRMGAAILSLVVIEFLRRIPVSNLNSHIVVSRALFWINSVQMFSLLVIALTGNFAIAALGICVAIALAEAHDPIRLAWLNQNVESRVRATVISITSQVEAFGRTAGSPLLGGIASVLSVRSALALSGLAIFPALLFYFRAFGQGKPATVRDVKQE